MNLNNPADRKHRWRRKKRKFLMIPAIIIIGLIKAAAVLFLWNELVPELFHGPSLTYLQAIELLILTKLLLGFGGMRWKAGHHHRHHRFGGFGRHGGREFKDQWLSLTPEEREKMRDDLRNRWER